MDTKTTGPWRKSTFSGSNGNCVEFAPTETGVAMRDSKDPAGPVLNFTKAEIEAMLDGAAAGEFRDLV